MKIRVTPLSSWDTDEREFRLPGQFKASYSETLQTMAYELDRISVEEANLELDLPRSAISSSGMPMPGRVPESPRVRLSFYHPEMGHLQYPCDTYYRWHHNVRAIALTLESQRAIDRYGAASQGQQYKGWQQLPPGQGSGEDEVPAPTDSHEAAELVATASGEEDEETILMSEGFFRYCYKTAAKKMHPDTGGSAAEFKALQIAKDLLEEWHRGDSADKRCA